MARVPLKDRAELPEVLRQTFDAALGYGPFAHQVGALAHRPPIMTHTYGMLAELRAEGVLARRHLELALVAVSQLNACAYCVAHHTPMLRVEGVSAAGVANLLDYRDHPGLDEVDRLVVEWATRVTEAPGRIPDALFERLRAHFSAAQIVELTWRIALCGAFNRFNDALGLEIEPEAEPAESVSTGEPMR
jgi:uncharacterized peroxidase-related enzyme